MKSERLQKWKDFLWADYFPLWFNIIRWPMGAIDVIVFAEVVNAYLTESTSSFTRFSIILFVVLMVNAVLGTIAKIQARENERDEMYRTFHPAKKIGTEQGANREKQEEELDPRDDLTS